MMLNKVILKGNIGKDPIIGRTQDGREIGHFSLATSSSWKTPEGERHKDWHWITVFREATVNWMKDALKKGDPVYVEGKLSYSQRTSKEGHSSLEATIVISKYEGTIELLRTRQFSSQDTESLEEETLSERDPHRGETL